MMIKVEAYVREDKFEDVKAALNAIGVNGLTVSQVMGCGIQRGYKEIVRGMQVDMQMQPKIKFEIVVSSEEWEAKTIEAIEKLPIQENLAMVRYLRMRFVMLKRFVRKKLDMMRFRQQNNKNNNKKGLSENR